MRALITRPQEDAEELAAALHDRGIEPLVEPLLQIRPIKDAYIDLDQVQAVLFTSANGVRAFAAKTSRRDLPAFTVGDGSARAANLAGFGYIESAGGDVNALASLVADRLRPEDGILFHAAGSVSAGDLAGQLERAGFSLRRVAIYEAEAVTSLSPETRMNLTLGGIDLVLLFSPRTATTFADLWQQAGSPNLDRVCAICLSAAVAREVGELSWRDVFIAERPDLPSLLALVDAELQRKDEIMADTSSQTAAQREPGRAEASSGDRVPSDGQPSSRTTAGGGLGRLITAVVVAALVAGGVTVTAPRWQPLLGFGSIGAPTSAVSDLQQSVAQLSAHQNDFAARADISAALAPMQDDVAKLKTAIASLAQTPTAGSAQADNLTPLNDKVAALETSLTDLQTKVTSATSTAPASTAPDLTPEVSALKMENQTLRDQINMLSSKLDSLGKDDLGKVDENLGQVTQRVATLEAQVAAAPAPVTARQQLATATVLAVGQLQSHLAGTAGFSGDLTALKQLAGSDAKLGNDLNPVLDKLTPVATAGAPTLSQLQASLPVTEIARAAEAEEAGALNQNAGWWQRITHRLAEVVTVRPVGEDVTGDGPLEHLARGEAVLKKGDLAKAVAEISSLTGEPARHAAPWLAEANARLTLDWASTALADLAARQLAPATSNSN